MPVITKISPQKDKNRVNIYLDGKFAFGLDLENFIKLKLKVNQTLSEEKISEIVKKSEYAKTFNKLVKFAMTRPRSKREYFDWFRRKKVHESIHEKLLSKLKKLKLLDDREFAKWWVEQRIMFKKASKRQIVQELVQKGISKEIINESLDQAFDEETELKNAKELLEKYSYKWQRADDEKKKEKIVGFLQRKGFGWNVIKGVLD